jgi:cell division protease FtsH
MLLGGRVAEEMVFGEITTGDQNDIERATKIARQMVMEYGMSEKLGPVTLGHKQEQVFLGRDFVAEPNYSDQVAFEIDQEVHRLVGEAHSEAQRILKEQRERLDVIAKILVDKETIDKEDLENLLQGEPADIYKKFLEEKEKIAAMPAPEPETKPDGVQKPWSRKPKPSPSTNPKPGIQPE